MHADTGLVLANLSAFSSLARMRHLVFYLLSHAAVARSRPAVRYFGAARGAFDSGEIMAGSPAGFDDAESLTFAIMSAGEGLTAAAAAYDRAEMASIDMQDVVVSDDIKAARRLPVASIAMSGPDIEDALAGAVEFDPADITAARPPALSDILTNNAPMAKRGAKNAGAGAGAALSASISS